LCIYQQPVGTQAEFSGALAGVELGGRRQECPVQFLFLAQGFQER
jgi:hypothetical protein